MTRYEGSTPIQRPADAAFDYLSDVTRLPEYFPQITSVEKLDADTIKTTAHIEPPGQPAQDVEGQVWFRVREAGQSLEWGSEGPNNYRGELDIDPDGEDSCTLTVRIDTDKEADSVPGELDKAVKGVAAAIEKAVPAR